MAEFEDGTWCPGISEVIKVVGIISESSVGVMGCNMTLGCDMHDTLRITSPELSSYLWAEMLSSLPEYMTPAREDMQHMVGKMIHCGPMIGLTPFPPWHTLATPQHGHYHSAYARRHLPTSPYKGERRCDESWGNRKTESQGTKREAWC